MTEYGWDCYPMNPMGLPPSNAAGGALAPPRNSTDSDWGALEQRYQWVRTPTDYVTDFREKQLTPVKPRLDRG